MGSKKFEYIVSVDQDGVSHAEERAVAGLDLTWSPEHLLLESLLRCSIQSLRFHADRTNVALEVSGVADATVKRPAGEHRMRIVDVTCRFDVALGSSCPHDAVEQLLADAEHDCFVGATLKPATSYEWRVDGELRQPAGTPSGLRVPDEPRPESAAGALGRRADTAGLGCDRCGRAAPAGDLAEWHAWNPSDM
ncbi:MAG: OsmC family protein, partial [Gaiellaceae bacterium]